MHDAPQRASFAALGLLASLTCLTAQAPSAWSTLTPPGGVNPTALEAGSTVLTYRDGDYMRVYSAITRTWHAHQPSFGTSVVTRDHFVATPESDRWTAFSAYRGTFETLFVNLSSTTWNASETMMVVREGTTVHVFSTYTGAWLSHTVPADWSTDMRERIVVFADYTTTVPSDGAAIFDGTRGVWHDVPAQTGRLVTHTGTGSVLIELADQCLGFSTQRGAIETLPAPVIQSGNTFGNGYDDLVGHRGIFWSGLSGTMTQPPYAPPDPWYLQTNYTISGHALQAQQQNHPTEYAAGLAGIWHPVPAGMVRNGAGRSFLMYKNGAEQLAFNALTDQWTSQTLAGTSTLGAGGADVSVRVDGATQRPWLYSALTDSWYEAPADVLSEPGPLAMLRVIDDGVVMPTATGMVGFSAYDGSFTPLVAPGATPLLVFSVLGARDAGHIYLFDVPRRRWVAHAIDNLLSLQTSDHVLLAENASQVVAFGTRGGNLEALPITGAVLDRRAHPDFAWVRTANEVRAFSAMPEHFSWTGAPLAAACSTGTLQRHQVQLGLGDLALFGLGPRLPGGVNLPGLGRLWLHPTAMATVLLAQTGAERRVMVEYTIPDTPTLHGSEWLAQPMIWRAGGTPYLADATSFVVF